MRSSFEKALERSGPKGLFSKIPWKKSEQWLVLALGKGALHWADLLAPDERVLDFLMLDHPDASGSVLAEHWKQEKKLLIGDHPLPDLHSVLSAEALIRWITERANENPSAHWAVILSGGTSSLMFLPAEGISIESARKKSSRGLNRGSGFRNSMSVVGNSVSSKTAASSKFSPPFQTQASGSARLQTSRLDPQKSSFLILEVGRLTGRREDLSPNTWAGFIVFWRSGRKRQASRGEPKSRKNLIKGIWVHWPQAYWIVREVSVQATCSFFLEKRQYP